uniref:Uncharacterized protein n=1 Tax=Glossina pallidipes TaxID=7398 RepID=A0A1A9Z218_GLOPL
MLQEKVFKTYKMLVLLTKFWDSLAEFWPIFPITRAGSPILGSISGVSGSLIGCCVSVAPGDPPASLGADGDELTFFTKPSLAITCGCCGCCSAMKNCDPANTTAQQPVTSREHFLAQRFKTHFTKIKNKDIMDILTSFAIAIGLNIAPADLAPPKISTEYSIDSNFCSLHSANFDSSTILPIIKDTYTDIRRTIKGVLSQVITRTRRKKRMENCYP